MFCLDRKYIFTISSLPAIGSDELKTKAKQTKKKLTGTIYQLFSDLGAKLAKTTNPPDRKRETDWNISLAHHLLKELSVNQHYRLDMFSEFKKDSCSCCNEPIGDYGEYDDCSLGKLNLFKKVLYYAPNFGDVGWRVL